MGKASATAMAFVLALMGAGCSNWPGFGFRADGPEMSRLREIMLLKPGMAVANVGAGGGELTLALAREVGSGGRVFSSDIDPDRVAALRAAVAKENLRHVAVVEANSRETGLPAACCDAIVLRRVYHHLTNPAEINAGLLQALRPSGLLVVIDFPPPFAWIWPWPPEGVPSNRGGHGVAARLVIDEVTASGFVLKETVNNWPGPRLLDTYCVVFQKQA
jgi:ubiquinone/menaquinone biosynthesis C-methylase UbiE